MKTMLELMTHVWLQPLETCKANYLQTDMSSNSVYM